jgi:hypothetical protein
MSEQEKLEQQRIVKGMLKGYANGRWLSDVEIKCQPCSIFPPMWYCRFTRKDAVRFHGIAEVR